jgi:pimeloyl-ACP methyl ester carboxylesterase
LLEILDRLGVGECDLLGSSYGGGVAMLAASLAPQRVRSLVLAAPVNPWSAHGKLIARILTSSFIYWAFERLAPRCTIAHGPVLRRLYGDPRRIRPGTLEEYSAPYRHAKSFAAHKGILKSWSTDLEILREALPRIADIPALLLWGTLDKAVDPRSAFELAKQFHNARVVTIEGAGHMPYEEVPEQFSRAVLEFLR